MKLGETLFNTDHQIFEVTESDHVANYLDWELVPLAGKTLAKEYTASGLADGHFILEGIVVHKTGETEKGYLDISLPERDTGSYFLKVGGEIIRGLAPIIGDSQIIPGVAIEKSGIYDQYYVKGHAEIGLKILREGLSAAKLQWPIANDLAYILRDEKRYREAIDAFTIVIQQYNPYEASSKKRRFGASVDYFCYAERAKLFDKLNNQQAAERDWEQVKYLAGPEILKNLRGF